MTLYGLMGYRWLQLKERTQSEERAENPGPHVGRRLQANGKTTKGSANARERSSVRPRLLPIFTS